MKVRVRGFSKPVILRRVDGSSAEIEAGPLRMKVAVEEITGIEGMPAPRTMSADEARKYYRDARTRAKKARPGEINVIGMTVEEASERVDKFLDEAALANRTRVRIIHGHGTGALRKGLGEFLKTHPLVETTQFSLRRGGSIRREERIHEL